MSNPKESIASDFGYHKPDAEGSRKIQRHRDMLADLCLEILQDIPEGREASVFKTKLEEAMFWASAAVARKFPLA